MTAKEINLMFKEIALIFGVGNEGRYWGPGHIRVLLSETDHLEASLHKAEERIRELEDKLFEALNHVELFDPNWVRLDILLESLKEQPCLECGRKVEDCICPKDNA